MLRGQEMIVWGSFKVIARKVEGTNFAFEGEQEVELQSKGGSVWWQTASLPLVSSTSTWVPPVCKIDTVSEMHRFPSM